MTLPAFKVCKGCGADKPLEDYFKQRQGKYGRRSQCRDCQNAYLSEWRRRNPDKQQASAARNNPKYRQRYQTPPPSSTEAKAAAARRVKQRHAELCSRTQEELAADLSRLRPDGTKRCRSCRQRRPVGDFSRATGRPDGLFDSCRDCKRRGGAVVSAEVLRFWSVEGMSPNVCTYCERELDYLGSAPGAPMMTVDHIVPVKAGGGNEPANLAPACRSCNSSKGSKALSAWLTT